MILFKTYRYSYSLIILIKKFILYVNEIITGKGSERERERERERMMAVFAQLEELTDEKS